MAKDEQPEESAAAPKSKKMLLIIIVALVVVVAIAVGGFMMMSAGKKKHGGKDDAEVAAEEHGKPAPVVVFEEKFTVNLQTDDGASHYIQVPKLELEMATEEIAKKVEERKSKISDRVNSTLRSKTFKEMLEPGSDLKLKEELKKVINETLEIRSSEAEKKGVKEVILPSSFIVQ